MIVVPRASVEEIPNSQIHPFRDAKIFVNHVNRMKMHPIMGREQFSGTRQIWALFMEEVTTPFDFHLDQRHE
jgi:hypothetical protein